MPEPSFITRAALCTRLNLHPSSARRWELAGRLVPFVLTSGCIRYRVTDVERLLAEAQHSTRRRPGPRPKPRQIAANPQPTS